MSSRNLARRRARRPFGTTVATNVTPIESLERRTLLSATLTASIDPIQLAPNTTATAINLNTHFNDPTVTGTTVLISTTQGDIPIQLFDQQEPNTVANFLHYVNADEYDATVIQRAVPGFLLQGGGFTADQSHINTTNPVANEFTGISNTKGTIAAALTTDPSTQQVQPDSATSDWFINDGNNTSLDAQKFVVFGKVIYNGMNVVDQIEALPKGVVAPTFEPNVNAGDPADGVLPLQNYNQGSPIRTTNYVLANVVGAVNALAYSVTSDNTAIANASITGTSLLVNGGSTNGVAHITVTATDLGGNTVTSTFAVQVGQTQAIVGKGQSKLVRFTDPDGSAGQITLSGPGAATVSFGGLNLSTTPGKGGIITIGGTPQNVTVTVTGATAATTLTITGGGGGDGLVDLASINSDGPMRAINGRTTAVNGNITTGGGVANSTLAKIINGVVNFNSGSAAAFNVGTMNFSSLVSATSVKSISVNDWSTLGTINVATIGKFNVKSAFGAHILATSVQAFSAGSVNTGTFDITGNLASFTAASVTGSILNVGSLGRFTVKGAFDSSNLNSTGNITTVTANTLTNSHIFAAISSPNIPSQPSDFSGQATIKTVKVKKLDLSTVAAPTLGNINLGVAQPPANPSPFGASAHQIAALSIVIDGKAVKLKKVTSQDQVTAAYTAAGVTSTQPEVAIF